MSSPPPQPIGRNRVFEIVHLEIHCTFRNTLYNVHLEIHYWRFIMHNVSSRGGQDCRLINKVKVMPSWVKVMSWNNLNSSGILTCVVCLIFVSSIINIYFMIISHIKATNSHRECFKQNKNWILFLKNFPISFK